MGQTTAYRVTTPSARTYAFLSLGVALVTAEAGADDDRMGIRAHRNILPTYTPLCHVIRADFRH
jgi:hypothetical protein